MSVRWTEDDSQLDWERIFDEGSPSPPLRGRGVSPGRSAAPRRAAALGIESFATGATAAVSTLQLRSTIAAVAESQLERWRAGATVLLESDAWARNILRNDYWTGIGIPNPATFFGSPTWWSAVAWSAAFIMACAQKTQAALQLPSPVLGHPTLTSNAAHAAYTWQAAQDRAAGRRGRYWAHAPADVLVEAGDIVVKARGTVTAAQAATAMNAATFASFTAHADIVARIDAAGAQVIGGNVSNSVTQTTYALTAAGRVDTTLAANAADHVFAILKPEGAAFSGRLLGMVV